jgi:pectinesterase
MADLGRPWRSFASVTYINCVMGDHIRPEGWNNWGKPENEKTARYAEYRSTGPGANPDARVKWSRQLTDDEAKACTAENVLRGSDGWNPSARQ